MSIVSESHLLKPCEAPLCGTMALRHFCVLELAAPLVFLFDKYVRTSASITEEKNK